MIFIVPYNLTRKSIFVRLKETLQAELRDFNFEIQHVGSTAIHGLAAKPILDIDTIIEDKMQLAGVSAR